MNPDSGALDEIDQGILQILQQNARHNSASDIAEEVGVTANTVRNRIASLEEQGVIDSYVPNINYEAAGCQLQVRVIASTQIPDREEKFDAVKKIPGVISVFELMNGKENIEIVAVASNSNRLTEIVSEISEVGLAVESENLIKQVHYQPYNHFGPDRNKE